MAGVSMQGIALGDSILATALGTVGPATVQVAFPSFSYQYDPSQPAAAPAATSAWNDFILRSVVRPEFTWGPVRYAPGDGYPDWSGAARLAVWGSVFTAAGVALWVLYRAFSPSRRSNPCRTCRTVTAAAARRSSPHALARARRTS